MEQKQKRRMESNRESARRSRMRKQKHLDDLTTQVNHLRKENHQILTALNIRTQNCLLVQTQNSVLRTQMMELESRLHSLNDILCYMNATACATTSSFNTGTNTFGTSGIAFLSDGSFNSIASPSTATQLMNPWSSVMHMSQPIDL